MSVSILRVFVFASFMNKGKPACLNKCRLVNIARNMCKYMFMTIYDVCVNKGYVQHVYKG